MDRGWLRRSEDDMLSRLVTIGAGALATTLAAAGLALTASPAFADGQCVGATGCTPDAPTTSGHSVVVRVSGDFVKGGSSGSSGGSTTVSVPSPCWYTQGYSGKEYYEWVTSGKANQLSVHTGGEPYTPIDGYEKHKDDDKGHYYGGECSSATFGDDLDGFFKYSDKWFADHGDVWVPGGAQPPVPPIPPQVLLEAAQKAMTMPDPVFAISPDRTTGRDTIVNLSTWFWLTNPVTKGSVTASAGGNSATVNAGLESFEVTSADGDSTGPCDGTGTPWRRGATSDCTIEFVRPTAGTDVTATTNWGLSWSYDGEQRGELDGLTAAWTRSVSVDQVQTTVTGTD